MIPFSTSNEPELIVRRHAILINMEIKAIVLRDKVLVIIPEGSEGIIERVTKILCRSDPDDIDYEGRDVAPGNESAGDWLTTLGADGLSPGPKEVGIAEKLAGSMSSDSLNSGALKSQAAKDSSAVASRASTSDSTEIDNVDTSADDESEWEEINKREWIDLPFELRCLDAVLTCVSQILSEDTLELQQAAHRYIERAIRKNQTSKDDPLTILRAVKDAAREMSSRVKGFVQSITRTLGDYEDMALMNLSRLLTNPELFIQPVPLAVLEEESDEPELILEAYLQVGLSLANSLELISGQVDSGSELVHQNLDSVRNKILFANMMISVFSLLVGTASLVGSFFGMNLINHLEYDPKAFYDVTFGTIGAVTALFLFIITVLYKTGTVPLPGLGRTMDN